MEIYTTEGIRRRFPDASEELIQRVVLLLNRRPAKRREIWAGEDQRGDDPQELGADGLTDPMRELNAFAERNGLPIPFPPRQTR